MKATLALRGRRVVIAAVAIFALAGGIAYAAIPDASGVINACYRTSTDDQKGAASCRRLSGKLSEQRVADPVERCGPQRELGSGRNEPDGVAGGSRYGEGAPTAVRRSPTMRAQRLYVCSGLNGQDASGRRVVLGGRSRAAERPVTRSNVTDTGVTIASSRIPSIVVSGWRNQVSKP